MSKPASFETIAKPRPTTRQFGKFGVERLVAERLYRTQVQIANLHARCNVDCAMVHVESDDK